MPGDPAPPAYFGTVNAIVPGIAVASAFDTAVTPTNQLISNRPIACATIAPTGMTATDPNSTPAPSAHLAPNSFEYRNQLHGNATTAPAMTPNQLTPTANPATDPFPWSNSHRDVCGRHYSLANTARRRGRGGSVDVRYRRCVRGRRWGARSRRASGSRSAAKLSTAGAISPRSPPLRDAPTISARSGVPPAKFRSASSTTRVGSKW